MKILIEESVLWQALEALVSCTKHFADNDISWNSAVDDGINALRTALDDAELGADKTGEVEQDLNKCPSCGGPADNGFSREIPPSPYYCTKCMEKLK